MATLDDFAEPYWIIEATPNGPLAIAELEDKRRALCVYTSKDIAQQAITKRSHDTAKLKEISADKLAEILWYGTRFFDVSFYCINGNSDLVCLSSEFFDTRQRARRAAHIIAGENSGPCSRSRGRILS